MKRKSFLLRFFCNWSYIVWMCVFVGVFFFFLLSFFWEVVLYLLYWMLRSFVDLFVFVLRSFKEFCGEVCGNIEEVWIDFLWNFGSCYGWVLIVRCWVVCIRGLCWSCGCCFVYIGYILFLICIIRCNLVIIDLVLFFLLRGWYGGIVVGIVIICESFELCVKGNDIVGFLYVLDFVLSWKFFDSLMRDISYCWL